MPKKEEEGKYRESSSDIVKLDVNEVTYCLLEYLGCSKYVIHDWRWDVFAEVKIEWD